jgi:ABC-2 type transport system permease protein
MITPTTLTRPAPAAAAPRRSTTHLTAVAALARRRLALSARTPRELLIPIMTPLLFALVIAPALGDTVGQGPGGIDYMTFVAVSTIGLLVPISCMTAGLGVVVDRLGGARRDLLAAPISRPTIVVGNLLVSVGLSALQILVVIGASALRGANFDVSPGGLGWFIAAALGFNIGMYGVAEILANRMPTQEEYIGALPAIAIVPWFLAGSLFSIDALPVGLTVVAKILPITHVMALLRYGLVDDTGHSLHDIWGMSSTTTMALLSLTVVGLFAIALTALSVRVFQRAAVD